MQRVRFVLTMHPIMSWICSLIFGVMIRSTNFAIDAVCSFISFGNVFQIHSEWFFVGSSVLKGAYFGVFDSLMVQLLVLLSMDGLLVLISG